MPSSRRSVARSRSDRPAKGSSSTSLIGAAVTHLRATDYEIAQPVGLRRAGGAIDRMG
ncbi:hypothetical protein [Streptomyces sp. NPDC017556]|uniref:hypothetical protein n=1 Tax=Streptomyces sp. NPDC017556 TaxID=3365002 RepID=UPI0037B29192